MQFARKIRRRLNDWYWEIRMLPQNLKRSWKLLRVYWGTCDSDWSSIAIVLLHQIRQVRKAIDENQIVVNADRYVRQMRIAERCLERMMHESYADLADKQFPERNRNWANRIQELEKQDMEMLLRQLRYLQHWWD